MTIKTLYRYKREDGGYNVSPVKPEGGYSTLYRIIADEGKLIQKDEITTPCVDTEELEGWIEIDDPDYIPEEE